MNNKILQLQKRDSYEFKNIQDKYAYSWNGRLFAIADGTTQSFNSETWAELITKKFIESPSFKPTELISHFTKYVKDYKNSIFEYSLNPAIASLEKAKQSKGGTATFVGAHFKENNHLDVISCGDTNLFIVNSGSIIKAFPFEDINSLDSNNRFINTECLINGKVEESYFTISPKTFQYKPNDIVVIATDALSRLLLSDPTAISKLLKIETFDDLHKFCMENWENKKLQEDDISAIIISTTNFNDPIHEILPPKGFTFPRIEVKEFVPSANNYPGPSSLSDEDMKRISNQLNDISSDLLQMNNKINLNRLLIIILFLFGVLISLLLFFKLSSSFDDEASEIPPTRARTSNSVRTPQKPVSEISPKSVDSTELY